MKPDIIRQLVCFRPKFVYYLFLFFLVATSTNTLASDKQSQNTESSPRPLSIRNAGPGIADATLTGPQFHASYISQGTKDFYHPRIKKMREDYDFLKSVEGETCEFRKIPKLRHWIHSQWPIDNSCKFTGNAFAILEKAKTGTGFHRAHCMVVQHAVMSSMGLVARDLSVDANHAEFGHNRHHGVNEVWSNDYAKWVLLDAKYDFHFESDGVSMSALQLHEAVRAGETNNITKVKGVERKPTPMENLEASEARVQSYWWVAYHLGQSTLTQPHLDDGSRLVIFDNRAFRQTT